MSINKSDLTKSITNRGGFSMVPNDIWTQTISNHAKIVYMYLLAQSEKWNPGSREIATGTSIGRDSVRNALKELEAAKMITISEGPRGLRDIYQFNPLEDWSTGPKQVQTPTKVGTPLDLSKPSTGPNQVHIQEESKTNLTLTKTQQQAAGKQVSEILSFKDKKDSFDLLMEQELLNV